MKRAKRDAVFSFALALLFYGFFDASKHVRSFAQNNPFAADPYDAIGSFAVQVALFLGLLSMLRAFRPCTEDALVSGRLRLIATSRMLSAIATGLTMLADATAVIRQANALHSDWPGWFLLGGIVGLLVLSSGRFCAVGEKAEIPAS